MINKITKDSSSIAKSFVLPLAIYPYANYKKYGLQSKIFTVYEINSKIFTKYDDSIQICFDTISDSECKEIYKYIKDNNIRMVSAKQEIITKLAELMNNCSTYVGYIFENTKLYNTNLSSIDHPTKEDEFKEIANLVCACNSNNKSYYALNQYFKQIHDRFLQHYCRNWIYKINSKIVGHIATYAETNEFAILAGLAVDENYRHQGIAKNLLYYSINELIKENKTVYWFCYNNDLYNFYKSISSKCYKYGKLMIQR